MTISDAIEELKILKMNHGDNVKIYFDCPKCNISFTPDFVAAVSIHLKTKDAKS